MGKAYIYMSICLMILVLFELAGIGVFADIINTLKNPLSMSFISVGLGILVFMSGIASAIGIFVGTFRGTVSPDFFWVTMATSMIFFILIIVQIAIKIASYGYGTFAWICILPFGALGALACLEWARTPLA